MRIIVTVPWTDRLGGAEAMLHTILEGADQSGHQLELVFFDGGSWPDELRQAGMRVEVIDAGRVRHLHRLACRVSFTDSEGVLHGVDVDAESLYEAVGIAVAQFRDDDVCPSIPGPMTEFTVAVYRNPTEHKIRLGQVAKWAQHTVKEGPAGITKRQRVRVLLGRRSRGPAAPVAASAHDRHTRRRRPDARHDRASSLGAAGGRSHSRHRRPAAAVEGTGSAVARTGAPS